MPLPLSGEAYFTANFDSAIVREDLASQDETRQTSALMQVVAYMAAGKDMSGLFSSVAALTSATNVRLKRLTYLYLIQNSRVQAEKAVLQAGTFVKDTFHDSPLYRGAALRTMTSLEVNVMSDFATAPLQRCLRDSDPYVRRIACFGVLKQYCTSPNITLDGELLHILPELLQDRNPAVVAAAVQVMLELKDRHCPVSFTPALRAALPQLLVRLASAGEWALWGLLEGIALSLTPAAARQPFIGGTHMTLSGDADEKKKEHRSRAGASHRGSAAQTSDDVAQRHMVVTTASDHATEASEDNSASDKDDAEEEEDLTRRLQSGFVARAEVVMTHVMPYLMLNNAAVVIAAVKNVALFLRTVEKMPADELSANERARVNGHYGPILVRALVGQLDAPRFEIRYSALRVIELLLSPQPDNTVISDRGREEDDEDTRSVGGVPLAVLRPYFMQHLSCFLLHHDDPIFIKLEKLDVLVSLADKSNGAQILSELVVYVTETDAELVKRSVRSIGYLATTLPDLAGRCVKELQYLIETEIAHIVEDTVVVVQLILQCYPGQFVDIIPTLCRSLSVLQEVESKVAVVWMLGEYTEHIPDAMTDYIGFFIDSFDTQPVLVRLALLSALAKIYLRHSDNASKEQADVTTLEQLIARCVKSPVPDLRDRAFFYWRLLAMDVRVARRIVLPAAHDVPDAQHYLVRRESKSSSQFDKELLALGRLSSVLHISPAQFTRSNEDGLPHSDADDDDEDEDDDALSRSHTITSHVTGHGMSRPESASDVAAADGERKDTATLPRNGKAGNEALTNLFTNGKPGMLTTPQSLVLDANAVSSSAPTPSHPPPAYSHPTSPSTQSIAPTTVSLQIGERTASTGYVIVLPASAANGVEVAMSWSQMDIKLVLNCRFRLVDGEDYVRQAKIVQLQVNRNMFGLGVAQVFPIISLERGDKASEMGLIISCNNQKRPTREVEVAIGMEEIGVRYCLAPPVPANLLLLPATGCEPGYFVELLNEYAEPAWVMPPRVEPVQTEIARMTVNALRVFGLNLVHRKALPIDTGVPTTGYFIYAETIARQKLLVELTLQANVIIYLSIRCSYVPIAPFFGQYILQSLSKTTLPLSQEIL